jgi:hypothetical protein
MVGIGLGVGEVVAAGVAVGGTGVGVDGDGVRTGVAVLVGDGVAVCVGFGVAECRARGCNCGRPSTEPRALGAAADENANSIAVMPKSRATKSKILFIGPPKKVRGGRTSPPQRCSRFEQGAAPTGRSRQL